MAVQHVFISINKSALIRNLMQNSILPSIEKMSFQISDTIAFKLFEVDGFELLLNRLIGIEQQAFILQNLTVNESTIAIFNIYIVERHFPFLPHLTGTQHILGGLRFDFNFRHYPIILNFTILP